MIRDIQNIADSSACLLASKLLSDAVVYNRVLKFTKRVCSERGVNENAIDILHDVIIKNIETDKNIISEIRNTILSKRGQERLLQRRKEDVCYYTCIKCKEQFPDTYRVNYKTKSGRTVSANRCLRCEQDRKNEICRKMYKERNAAFYKKKERTKVWYEKTKDERNRIRRLRYAERVAGIR